MIREDRYMKKFTIGLFLLCLVIIIAIFTVFKKDENNNNLTKVTLADTTLTSRTYTS